MSWLTILKYALQIVAYLARRSERLDVEKAVLNELEILQGKRVERAASARDDVVSGRVYDDDNDPYNRDR